MRVIVGNCVWCSGSEAQQQRGLRGVCGLLRACAGRPEIAFPRHQLHPRNRATARFFVGLVQSWSHRYAAFFRWPRAFCNSSRRVRIHSSISDAFHRGCPGRAGFGKLGRHATRSANWRGSMSSIAAADLALSQRNSSGTDDARTTAINSSSFSETASVTVSTPCCETRPCRSSF